MTARVTRIAIITLLVSLTVFSIVSWSTDRKIEGWLRLYTAALTLLGFTVIVAMVMVAFRATVLAWITVLVLLAFAGNRRRVLVRRGKKITVDVAWDLVGVTLRQKGLFAVAFATVLSLLATHIYAK